MIHWSIRHFRPLPHIHLAMINRRRRGLGSRLVGGRHRHGRAAVAGMLGNGGAARRQHKCGNGRFQRKGFQRLLSSS
jgi:hypothetical protein